MNKGEYGGKVGEKALGWNCHPLDLLLATLDACRCLNVLRYCHGGCSVHRNLNAPLMRYNEKACHI